MEVIFQVRLGEKPKLISPQELPVGFSERISKILAEGIARNIVEKSIKAVNCKIDNR